MGFLFNLIVVFAGCQATLSHVRLAEDLLANYNTMIRPVLNQDAVVTVDIRPTLHQIRDLDEINQHLTTNMWIRFFWKDEFLTWNASEYNGIRRLHLKSSKIWRPDIVLYNSVDEERSALDLFSDTNVELSPDGVVSWTSPAMFKSACKIDIKSYPFDVQDCKLKFGSWTYHGLELNVSSMSSEVLTDNYIPNGEWIIRRAPCTRNEVYYSCCKEPFPDVTCSLVIERLPLFYIYNLVVPCFLLMFIGSLVFVLPPESGEKVSLAMTVLLSMTVFMLVVMENIPPTSEVVPWLEQFIGATIVLLTLSTSTAIWTVNCYFKGEGIKRPSRIVRKLVLCWLAHLVLIHDVIAKDTKGFRSYVDTQDDVNENGQTKSRRSLGKEGKFRRKKDGTGTVGSLRSDHSSEAGWVNDPAADQSDELLPEKSSCCCARNCFGGNQRANNTLRAHSITSQHGAPRLTSTVLGNAAIQPTQNDETTELLRRMYHDVNQLAKASASAHNYKVDEERAKREWRAVSMVLDRLFLLTFLVLVTLAVIALGSQIRPEMRNFGFVF